MVVAGLLTEPQRPTEGLLDGSREAFGRWFRRGRETRAEQCTKTTTDCTDFTDYETHALVFV